MRVRALFASAIVCTLAACSSGTGGAGASSSEPLTEDACKKLLAGSWALSESTTDATDSGLCSALKPSYAGTVTIGEDASWSGIDGTTGSAETFQATIKVISGECLLDGYWEANAGNGRALRVSRTLSATPNNRNLLAGGTLAWIHQGSETCRLTYETTLTRE